MGASNHPDLRFPKQRARALDADASARDVKKHERAIYKAVDARDGKRCLCCGRSGDPSARTTLGKIHHDHILERSLGGRTETSNISSLCWICHSYKTGHELESEGNPDTGGMTFRMTPRAAKAIFIGHRRRPPHVHLMDVE